MRHLAKSLAGSLMIVALLAPASHGEELPKSERQKAAEARREADIKATDEAYKATMKRTQDVKKTVDPWGNLRTPRAGSNN
jgi:hypothetical protein